MNLHILIALLFSFSVHAFNIPAFTPNVVDESGTLSPEEIESINLAIDDAQTKGVLPAVYLTGRLGDESIEDLSEKVFKKWQLGEKDKDNGVLILIAVADRKMRIEVGYGLEGNIPDIEAAKIIDEIMKPNFKNGFYSTGIREAIEAMGKLASGEYPSYSSTNDPEFTISPAFKERLFWWTVFFFGVPALIGTLGYFIAKLTQARGLKLLEEKNKKPGWRALGVSSGVGVAVKTFLFVNPGLFITLFPTIFDESGITLVMNILFVICSGIATLVSMSFIRDLFSAERVQKVLENEKNNIHSYTIMGKSFTISSGRSASSSSGSSSSSSSSSRSSSSGGGRSGGGGASGSW